MGLSVGTAEREREPRKLKTSGLEAPVPPGTLCSKVENKVQCIEIVRAARNRHMHPKPETL